MVLGRVRGEKVLTRVRVRRVQVHDRERGLEAWGSGRTEGDVKQFDEYRS